MEPLGLASLTGKRTDMNGPLERDTVDGAAPPITDGDQSPARSAAAVVDMAGLTDRGHRRPNNEDHFLISRFGRFLETLDTNLSPEDAPFREEETGYSLLVADGMGGHAGGEVASKLAISTLINLALATPDWILRLDDNPLMQEVMRRAKERWGLINTALTDHGEADPSVKGLGTTLTLTWSLGRNLLVAHIGDSRAYLYRRKQLHRLTHDHTFAQSLADQGIIAECEVARHRMRNVLTRVLGNAEKTVEPDLLNLTLEDGDVLLLCTDGLTDMVEESLIQSALDREEDSKTTCRRLVEQALEAGGKDNVTVAVAHYRFP